MAEKINAVKKNVFLKLVYLLVSTINKKMNKILMLSEKIRNAKHLDFGTILNEIIELFKKVWVQGLLLFLFSILIMLPIIILVYVPLIGVAMMESQGGTLDSEVFTGFFAGTSILYVLLIIVLFLILVAASSALIAGFYRIVKALDKGKGTTTSDFFYFFKTKYLTKLLLITLITISIAIGSALLCYLPLLYTMVPISYFLIVFAFNSEESVTNIVKIGFQLGTKKWGISIAVMLIVGLTTTMLGIITCGLGNLFLISLSYLPAYIIYKNVIGFEEDIDLDLTEKNNI